MVDRAAFAFFGTTTGGNHEVETFTGEWHLYVAHTYNRGLTWVTTDVTPNDPVQRRNVCGSGACRNLLDFFDADVDAQGARVRGLCRWLCRPLREQPQSPQRLVWLQGESDRNGAPVRGQTTLRAIRPAKSHCRRPSPNVVTWGY